MGDFNDVTRKEEKSGGNGICSRRVSKYTSCMDFAISLTWGSHGQSFRGQIGGNYLILFNKD